MALFQLKSVLLKLIRFGKKGAERPGVEVDGTRYDVSNYYEDWNATFFRKTSLGKLQKWVDKKINELPIVSNRKRLGSPVARPGKIICIGLNYADHAKESGMAVPTEPVVFTKASNTIAGPYDPVSLPRNSQKTDWEVELGVVLQRDALYLKNERSAEKCIAGYTIVNDLSEREFQLERGGQWVKGKSCPGFSPTGPYLVPKSAVKSVNKLAMQLSVNKKIRQNGSTRTMIFQPAYIVWYLSQFMELEAGDLISTGTPPGVGMGMNPPRYLKAGDVVRLEIEGLGYQKQRVVKS